ncbi:uncharacterized protein [Typha latifolia]|uniref:uncharacterized protein isoform X1 n=1 Tax=Typha latifolia TaxID=4733 RepID=UPI003C2F863C
MEEKETSAYEEMLRVVDSCISRIRWRLKPSSKRRLLNDILFLCTGLRPVVLVDYDGTMPQLQENLCALLCIAQKESVILHPLRVMVIEDTAYITHVKALAEHVSSSLSAQQQLLLVDLEQNPPKMLSCVEEKEIASEFAKVQSLFSLTFPFETSKDLSSVQPPMATLNKESLKCKTVDVSCSGELERASEAIDLLDFLQDAQITLPSLNGWLLGYPVTYLFSKKNAEQAMRNLSTQSLHIFKVFVSRNRKSSSRNFEDELMSFTVPCGMSLRQDKEPWADAFRTRITVKLKRFDHVWASMRMEITTTDSHCQAIVL